MPNLLMTQLSGLSLFFNFTAGFYVSSCVSYFIGQLFKSGSIATNRPQQFSTQWLPTTDKFYHELMSWPHSFVCLFLCQKSKSNKCNFLSLLMREGPD